MTMLAVAPPWCRPRFEPSKRRVTWPNGARAVCLSGEEPERARGLNENTRLGRQEIYAEFLEMTEGVWFTRFDPVKHVSVQAEFDPIYTSRDHKGDILRTVRIGCHR